MPSTASTGSSAGSARLHGLSLAGALIRGRRRSSWRRSAAGRWRSPPRGSSLAIGRPTGATCSSCPTSVQARLDPGPLLARARRRRQLATALAAERGAADPRRYVLALACAGSILVRDRARRRRGSRTSRSRSARRSSRATSSATSPTAASSPARPRPVRLAAAGSRRHDSILRFVYWKHQPSPYGPLFSFASARSASPRAQSPLWAYKLAAGAVQHRDRLHRRLDRPRASSRPGAGRDRRRAEPGRPLLHRQRRPQRPARGLPDRDRARAVLRGEEARGAGAGGRRRGGQADRRARAAVRVLAAAGAAARPRRRLASVAIGVPSLRPVRLALLRASCTGSHRPAVRHAASAVPTVSRAALGTHITRRSGPLHGRRGVVALATLVVGGAAPTRSPPPAGRSSR